MSQELANHTLPVSGMFCPHCEQRIQRALLAMPGVVEVHASFAEEQVRVSFRPEETNLEALEKTIEELGYAIEPPGTRWMQVSSIITIIIAIYFIIKHLGYTKIFQVFPNATAHPTSLAMLFVIGLLTSIHCLAMCGGINLAQGLLAVRGGQRLLLSNLAYNAGRVGSYTLVGALAGGLGSVLAISGRVRGLILVVAGLAMVLAALNLLGCFKRLRRFGLRLPGSLHERASRLLGSSSLAIGLLNGLMPCGPLQTMQLYALTTGSAAAGALAMFLFSLGTVPLMLGFGLFAGRLNRSFARQLLSVSAILVLLMGLHAIGNGLALGGIPLTAPTNNAPTAQVANGVQTIRTEIDYGDYPSITVHRQIPVEWTIVVPSGKLNGCNGEIFIPAFQLDIKLQVGENLVRFTPEHTGRFAFSCWMGMITGTIAVID